jgi:hypothetical protein
MESDGIYFPQVYRLGGWQTITRDGDIFDTWGSEVYIYQRHRGRGSMKQALKILIDYDADEQSVKDKKKRMKVVGSYWSIAKVIEAFENEPLD